MATANEVAALYLAQMDKAMQAGQARQQASLSQSYTLAKNALSPVQQANPSGMIQTQLNGSSDVNMQQLLAQVADDRRQKELELKRQQSLSQQNRGADISKMAYQQSLGDAQYAQKIAQQQEMYDHANRSFVGNRSANNLKYKQFQANHNWGKQKFDQRYNLDMSKFNRNKMETDRNWASLAPSERQRMALGFQYDKEMKKLRSRGSGGSRHYSGWKNYSKSGGGYSKPVANPVDASNKFGNTSSPQNGIGTHAPSQPHKKSSPFFTHSINRPKPRSSNPFTRMEQYKHMNAPTTKKSSHHKSSPKKPKGFWGSVKSWF